MRGGRVGDDALSVGAVARRLGVAVTTLRTWHRRYGLGPSQHSPGRHRRYTPDDLSRLETMRRLTVEGVAPAEAARWARRTPQAEEAEPGPVRPGDGRPLPGGRVGPTVRGLVRAAIRLDAAGTRTAITRAITTYGVVATWDRVLRPILVRIGERHVQTARYIEVEHLFSRCVAEALAAVPRPPATAGATRVLLSCADEEQHTLPLEALAAALAEVGVACQLLGARVPTTALVAAVARTGPAAVAVWSHTSGTADPGQLTAVLAAPRRPLLVLAAGPGWSRQTLPVGVISPAGLAEAVALIVAAAGSSGDRAVKPY